MEKNRRLQYSVEAVSAVINGMPVAKASKLFKVPRITIWNKVHGKSPMCRKMGPATVLTQKEEKLLVEWIFHIADAGFPATKSQLIDSVQLLVKNLKRPNNFTNGRPGRHWYEAFLRRHPELSHRVSQNLTNSRANVTELKIRNWFGEIKQYLSERDKLNILEQPCRIFNCDESAFYLSPKQDKVLVKKGEKTVYTFINNDEKECLTTLLMCSASGELPPPMIVYSYKRVPRPVVEKISKDWGVGRSDSGWMTGETFYEYITNIFYPWLVVNNVELPVILFVDGHTSHLTMAVSEFCTKNGIILISFVANATHILQPLDVAVFRPFKMEWKKSVHTWRMENNGKKLTREMFAPILKTTIDKMKHFPDVIKSGFRTCGLVPFEPNNINFKKYFKIENLKYACADSTNFNENFSNFLHLLEIKIGADKIQLFKSAEGNWRGDIEDTSLFNLWYSLSGSENRNHVTADNTRHLEEFTNSANVDELNFTLEYNEHPAYEPENENYLDTDLLDITDTIEPDNLMLPLVITVPKPDSLQSICNISSNTCSDADKIYVEDQKAAKESSEKIKTPHLQSYTTPVKDDTDTFQIAEDIVTEKILKTPEEKRNGEIEYTEDISKAFQTNANAENDNIDTCQTAIEEENNKENKSPNKIDDGSIPSPFKKSLFWPAPKTPVVKRRIREKVPSVASSKQWQDYYNRKEELKNIELQKKEQNKEERNKKKLKKEEIQKKKRKGATEETSSTDENIQNTLDAVISEVTFLEQHQVNVNVSDDAFLTNDYVIVNYNGQLLPGKITNIRYNQEDAEYNYEVSHMEKKGLNWIWPEKTDILWYAPDEIPKKICEPKLKNKRGLYCIEDMSDYVSES